MNLVVGATGLVGGQICRLLVERGERVRGLVRPSSDPARVEELQALGIETVPGDLKDPASLRAACAGVSTVLSTATSTISRGDGDSIETVDRQGQLSLVGSGQPAPAGEA